MTIFERLFKRGIPCGAQSLIHDDAKKGMWGWYFYMRQPTGSTARHECQTFAEGVRWLEKRVRQFYPRRRKVLTNSQRVEP